MKLDFNTYKNRIYGCWLGKNIGGTLGAPFEGKRQINDVSFYTQNIDGNPPPNDDLDLQLVWLNAVERFGRAIDAKILGEYWLFFIIPLWGEYGVAKTNLQRGLLPPLSGSFNNSYGESNGCFIRSEIWACLAPGFPDIAAKYAFEDAIVDHHGEGVYSEIFCAALESAAFVERDRFRLIDIALSYIPEDCDIAKGVHCAVDCYRSGKSWQEARETVLRTVPGCFGVQTYTVDEIEKIGLPVGKAGYDAPSNIAIVIIGLLYGENDFGNSVCIANNCGEDTDCTCATLGALLGILNGGDSIPEKWSAPIQDMITTCCINLPVGGIEIPKTVTELTDRILRLTPLFLGRSKCDILAEDGNYTIETYDPDQLFCPNNNLYLEGIGYGNSKNPEIREKLSRSKNTVCFNFLTFTVLLDYIDGPTFTKGDTKKLRLTFTDNPNFHEGNNQWLHLRWYTPEGVTVAPEAESHFLLKVTYNAKQVLEFEISTEKVSGDFDVLADISVDGHPNYGVLKASFISDCARRK